MKYIVYQTINKVNGKLYIGVHKTENPNIFDKYIGNGIYIGYSLENPKTVYQHALKKYGYSNFVRTTLKVFDDVQAALDMEASIVTAEFVKQDNNYNTALGGGYLVIYKTLYQFNNKRELIKKWEGNYVVKEYYGISLNTLQYAIHHKKILLDSYFSYDENPNFDEYTKYREFTLYQCDLDGNLLATFESAKKCSEELQCNYTSLQTAIQHKKKYKNCYWTYNLENIISIIKLNKLYNLANNAVKQFDINMNLIQEFHSITDAANQLNIKYHTLKAAINNKTLVQEKYYFSKVAIVDKHTKVGQYDKETGELVKVWDSIAQCAKVHPKAREVVKGQRSQTHGFVFKYIK